MLRQHTIASFTKTQEQTTALPTDITRENGDAHHLRDTATMQLLQTQESEQTLTETQWIHNAEILCATMQTESMTAPKLQQKQHHAETISTMTATAV